MPFQTGIAVYPSTWTYEYQIYNYLDNPKDAIYTPSLVSRKCSHKVESSQLTLMWRQKTFPNVAYWDFRESRKKVNLPIHLYAREYNRLLWFLTEAILIHVLKTPFLKRHFKQTQVHNVYFQFIRLLTS